MQTDFKKMTDASLQGPKRPQKFLLGLRLHVPHKNEVIIKTHSSKIAPLP